MRRGSMLDLVITNKEGLVENVKLEGTLGCSYHEIMKFRIQRAARMEHSKLYTLVFESTDFALFRDLFRRLSRDKALEGRGVQER